MPADWVARSVRQPAGVDLALALDQQLYPAVLPLISRHAAETGMRVAVQEGTCGIAAGALADKSADITGMCCPPGPLDRLPGVRYHTLGIAAIALIVHPDNPLSDLSLDQARALFGGRIGSWSELPVSGMVDGPGGEVRAVGRLHCKPRPGHWRLLLDNENLFSPDLVEVAAIKDMIVEVARSRNAIGYETRWHVADNIRAGRVKALRLDGVDPADGAALAAGRYPLYRVFNLTSWEGGVASDRTAGTVHWLVEHAGSLDPSYGIVPVQALRRAGWKFAGDELVGEVG